MGLIRTRPTFLLTLPLKRRKGLRSPFEVRECRFGMSWIGKGFAFIGHEVRT